MDGGLSSSVVRYFYLKQVTFYATTSSMLLLIHDFLSTFSQEVELVWRSQWSTPKVVYLLNRYSSLTIAVVYMITLFFRSHTTSRCELLGALSGWQSWISTSLVQRESQLRCQETWDPLSTWPFPTTVVLLTWLYALWGDNRRPLYAISTVCAILVFAVLATIMPFGGMLRFIMSDPLCVQALTTSSGSDSTLPDQVDLDSTTKFPTYLLVLFLTWAMFTVFLLGLIAWKVFRTFRERFQRRHLEADGGGLAYIIIRDCLGNAFAILCIVILNTVMTVATPTALYQACYGFNIVIPCILCSRILLNLREWEKYKEDQADVQDMNLSEWPTMFHVSSDPSSN